MSKYEVKNSEGQKVAEAELASAVYGIELRRPRALAAAQGTS